MHRDRLRHALATMPIAVVSVALLALPASGTPVQVVVDMDAATPGIQSHITVPAGDVTIANVSIYIVDPLGTREMWSIGYLGGIDRGIAFGHMPNPLNQGDVIDLVGAAHTPVHPAGFGGIITAPGLDKGFAGAEIQYVEWGPNAPAPIPSTPSAPVLTADIVISNGAPGDVFDFYLMDFVTVWSDGTAGAFSTQGFLTLDTGGDVVPDGTLSTYGLDADEPIPVPPAAFEVDYIDGGAGGGPATVTVASSTGVASEDSPDVGVTRLHPNVPNPFNPSTTIRFHLARDQHVRVSVHDVHGRTIRVLAEGSLDAGHHALRWNGVDAGGSAVASGVYFVRLTANGVHDQRPMTLTR